MTGFDLHSIVCQYWTRQFAKWLWIVVGRSDNCDCVTCPLYELPASDNLYAYLLTCTTHLLLAQSYGYHLINVSLLLQKMCLLKAQLAIYRFSASKFSLILWGRGYLGQGLSCSNFLYLLFHACLLWDLSSPLSLSSVCLIPLLSQKNVAHTSSSSWKFLVAT